MVGERISGPNGVGQVWRASVVVGESKLRAKTLSQRERVLLLVQGRKRYPVAVELRHRSWSDRFADTSMIKQQLGERIEGEYPELAGAVSVTR